AGRRRWGVGMRRGVDWSRKLKALLSPDSGRGGGTGRSTGPRAISWMEYRTLWDSVSVARIVRLYSKRVEAKTDNGTQGIVGTLQKRKRLDSTGRTCAGRNPRALG